MSGQPRALSLYALLTTCLCGQCSSIGKRWRCSCGSMGSRQWPGRLWPASFTVLWRGKPEKAIWVTAWPRSWRRTLCQLFFFTLKLVIQTACAKYCGPIVHNTTTSPRHSENKLQHNGNKPQQNWHNTAEKSHNEISPMLCFLVISLCWGDFVVLCTTGPP